MSDRDYAILVGISDYPADNIASLSGPERDVQLFKEWLVDPAGGAVPEDNIQVVLSSNFATATTFMGARPSFTDVNSAFVSLILKANEQDYDLGRRLYLFFSGHGFRGDDLDDSTLIMADADQNISIPNFPGRLAANKIAEAGFFEEVVLIMDCCRNNFSFAMGNLTWILYPQQDKQTKRFVAFAVPWGYEAKEAPNQETNEIESLFTRAVIKSLRHGRPQGGVLDSAALKKTIVKNYKEIIEDVGLNYYEPFIPLIDEDIIFKEQEIITTDLHIRLAPTLFTGINKIEVRTGQFELLETVLVNEADGLERIDGDMVITITVPLGILIIMLPEVGKYDDIDLRNDNQAHYVRFE